jgi:hypothetical protein
MEKIQKRIETLLLSDAEGKALLDMLNLLGHKKNIAQIAADELYRQRLGKDE